ncbi:hypothetical protein V1282_000895 [Nitrobacteraceae bacterium AZCC 2146]
MDAILAGRFACSPLRSLRHRIANAIYPRLPRYREMQIRLQQQEAEIARLRATAAAPTYQKMGPVQHRPFDHFPALKVGRSDAFPAVSDDLIKRIKTAYRAAHVTEVGPTDSAWLSEFSTQKSGIDRLLLNGGIGQIGAALANPLSNHLFHGFDSLTADETNDPPVLQWRAEWIYDNLLRFAEALGVRRMSNPESIADSFPPLEVLLESIDDAVGFRVVFPNPFQNEAGLLTSRGIATYRAVQALYQAWRIRQTTGTGQVRVVEIGAGTGRTAFYARNFGIDNYTIIDLPMTNIAQAYFLGATLGGDAIALYGEQSTEHRISVLPAATFFGSDTKFDLVVNVDSLTEMSAATAVRYVSEIKMRSKAFLSINHEANPFTVGEIAKSIAAAASSREHHWMRRGYIEETFRF